MTQNTPPIPVFGQPIDVLVKALQSRGAKSDIPNVITEAILWLDAHQGMTSTNIFRALGHSPTVNLIRSEFEAGTWNAANHKREDMHSITAVLKVYLRELPDSVFPSKYYSLLLKIIREVPDVVMQSYQIRVVVYSLPKHNRDTILYISNFLHRVAHEHKENGVTAKDLAHILAPYLIRPPVGNVASAESAIITSDVDDIALVVKRLVDEAPFFFKTTSRPENKENAQSSSAKPTTSILQGKALYAYTPQGDSKWLLPLKKDAMATLLDIKNEEGWLKVEMGGETGYIPLSYVQIVLFPPPTDNPSQRLPIPSECDVAPPEPVIPAFTPTPLRRSDEPRTAWAQASVSRHASDSPQFAVLHHEHSLSGLGSPDLSRVVVSPPPAFSTPPPLFSTPPPILSPPPPLTTPPPLFSTPPLHTSSFADLLPAPPPLADISNIPSLSSTLSPPPSSLPIISPRGLNPALSSSTPNIHAIPTLPQNKAASFNVTSSLPNSPISATDSAPAQAPLPLPISTRATMSRAMSLPPPRLIAPKLDLPKPELPKSDLSKSETQVESPVQEEPPKENGSKEETKDGDEVSSEKHTTEGADSGTEDEGESDDDSAVAPVVPISLPPPPPALPTALELAALKVDLEKEALNAKKRKERAEETLTTERTYVKQLTILNDIQAELKRKEKEKAPILSSTEIFAIFSNTEVILNCHRKLLDTLEKRMQSWDSIPELGDIFLENTAFIKLYKYYVNNFDKSIITLKKCKEKNPEFQKLAQEWDYTEKLNMLSIEAFLILPVQRIPRYVLLMQDLLKYTNSTHSDFNNLSNALAFIKDLADFINSNKSDADNINKIMGIQEALLELPSDFTLVVPKRRFIEEGGLLYKKQKAWVYLFSDSLLFTKLEKKGKRYKAMINLPTAHLNTTEEAGIIKIICTEGTFRFGAETPKDRDHWIKAIRETMDASRNDLLTSAFGDNIPSESGSNKQFMKIKDEENAAKKRNVVDRLVEGEQEYVDSITYISKTFLAPLRKAVDSPMPMIALSELIDISSNLETLLNCHIAFLQSMKERVIEWPEKMYVYDLFNEKAAFLKLYNYYVSNHHKSLAMLDLCIEKYPLFAIFLRDLEAREKHELKLLLQEPLRRVSQYYLLSHEMLQYIKAKTEEHDLMAKVVSRLKEQTEKLNNDLHATAAAAGNLTKVKKMEKSKSSAKFRITSSK